MELDLLGVAALAQEEVLAEEVEVRAGWEETDLEQDQLVSVFALPAAKGLPIRLGFPATVLNVPIVGQLWYVDKSGQD